MKDSVKKFGSNVLGKIKKLNRKAVIAVGAVLILGIAVMLNFLLMPSKTKTQGLNVAMDLSNVSQAIASKDEEASVTESNGSDKDAFAEMILSREEARDQAMEVLKSVSQSDTAVDSMKAEAAGEIDQIAKDIKNEANIESLIKAKGFEQCVAVVNGNTASVIVKTDGLLESEVAQISEIVYDQSGVLPTDLNIIESK